MIVKQHLKGWEIISHYTHGLLAGKIAMQLKNSLRCDYWEDILTAIIEHDDHLLDFDEKNYLTDMCTPLDFMLEKRTDDAACEHAERVYKTSLQKSQLVALMIGRHLEFLYWDQKENHSGFRSFFRMILKDRTAQAELYGWTKKKIESSYELMRFCDRCSLILCQGLVPAAGRRLEINRTIKKKTYFISEREELFRIEPWPFEKGSFQLQYETRLLEQPTFTDNTELSKAISNASVSLKKLKLSK